MDFGRILRPKNRQLRPNSRGGRKNSLLPNFEARRISICWKLMSWALGVTRQSPLTLQSDSVSATHVFLGSLIDRALHWTPHLFYNYGHYQLTNRATHVRGQRSFQTSFTFKVICFGKAVKSFHNNTYYNYKVIQTSATHHEDGPIWEKMMHKRK